MRHGDYEVQKQMPAALRATLSAPLSVVGQSDGTHEASGHPAQGHMK